MKTWIFQANPERFDIDAFLKAGFIETTWLVTRYLPDTLSDRSIVVPLQRKKPEDHVDRFRLDRVEQFDELRRKLARWAKDQHLALGDWDGDAPRELHDRAADNWRPLLAIADVVGGNWPQAARQAALALTEGEDENSAGALILRDLKMLFEDSGEDRLASKDVLAKLHQMDERPERSSGASMK